MIPSNKWSVREQDLILGMETITAAGFAWFTHLVGYIYGLLVVCNILRLPSTEQLGELKHQQKAHRFDLVLTSV